MNRPAEAWGDRGNALRSSVLLLLDNCDYAAGGHRDEVEMAPR